MTGNTKWWKYRGVVAGLALMSLAFLLLLRLRHNLTNPAALSTLPAVALPASQPIGREQAVPHHLQDGAEERIALRDLLLYGEFLFRANWTEQDGAGPLMAEPTPEPQPQANPHYPDRDETLPVAGMTARTRASGCFRCHNTPFALPGGGGDVADTAAAPGLFGAGYLEMLARQITKELQTIRNTLQPGEQKPLRVKGIDFGVLARTSEGLWDTTRVTGLPASSLRSRAADQPPSLLIRPFHPAGTFVSLRQFTNNAFNRHHGMQSTEIYGLDIDADEDGVANELTRADITAITLYQATLAPPGRVIANDPALEAAIAQGERQFSAIGCVACHIPQLPLDEQGWIFTEPNPYHPTSQLRQGEMPRVQVDLTDPNLPSPRLTPVNGVVLVPAYTDFKLHDISATSEEKFLTRRLWGVANEPPYFHDGRFTTLRAATLAHADEAAAARAAFVALTAADQDAVIEFLKSLQVLPPGAPATVIDEQGNPKAWPPSE